jgi:hypothetical protein
MCANNDPKGNISRLRALPKIKELASKVSPPTYGYNNEVYSIKGLPKKRSWTNEEWYCVQIETDKAYLERVHKLCSAIITSIRDCEFGFSHRVVHHNGETYVQTTVYID